MSKLHSNGVWHYILAIGLLVMQTAGARADGPIMPPPVTKQSLDTPVSWDDNTSPRKAAFLMHVAMQFPLIGLPCDQYCYGKDEFTRNWIADMSTLRRASDAFQAAVQKRFGDAGLKVLDMHDSSAVTPALARSGMEQMGDPAFAAIDKMMARVDGDLATYTEGEETLHFRNVKGKWLVEYRVEDRYRQFVSPPALTDFQVKLTKQMTQKVSDGEFAKAEDLKAEMERRAAEGAADLQKKGLIHSPFGDPAVAPATQP